MLDGMLQPHCSIPYVQMLRLSVRSDVTTADLSRHVSLTPANTSRFILEYETLYGLANISSHISSMTVQIFKVTRKRKCERTLY